MELVKSGQRSWEQIHLLGERNDKRQIIQRFDDAKAHSYIAFMKAQ